MGKILQRNSLSHVPLHGWIRVYSPDANRKFICHFIAMQSKQASEFHHVRYAHHDEKESPLSDQTKIKVITKMIHVPVAEKNLFAEIIRLIRSH